jgi:carbonic anhydrase
MAFGEELRVTERVNKMSDMYSEMYNEVFENNRRWVASMKADNPDYFNDLANIKQTPDFLYIGCSDSRVPANQIMGLKPGDVFVHRNIANMVECVDMNVQSVIEYAVEHLEVRHVIVCGHYGCGGVNAAMQPQDLGLLNGWLRNIRDVYQMHEAELDAIADEKARSNRLVELNVIEQCKNLIKTAVVQKKYLKHQYPTVHGWVYDLHDGLLKDLEIDFESTLAQVQKVYTLTE